VIIEPTAPGVHAGSGSSPWLGQPGVCVRGGGAHVLAEAVGVGAAGVYAGTGVGAFSPELTLSAVGGRFGARTRRTPTTPASTLANYGAGDPVVAATTPAPTSAAPSAAPTAAWLHSNVSAYSDGGLNSADSPRGLSGWTRLSLRCVYPGTAEASRLHGDDGLTITNARENV
jgi:hypothetical protein